MGSFLMGRPKFEDGMDNRTECYKLGHGSRSRREAAVFVLA